MAGGAPSPLSNSLRDGSHPNLVFGSFHLQQSIGLQNNSSFQPQPLEPSPPKQSYADILTGKPNKQVEACLFNSLSTKDSAIDGAWSGSVHLKPTSTYLGKPAVIFSNSDKISLINGMKHVLVAKFSHGRPSLDTVKVFFGNFNLKSLCNISVYDSKHLILECESFEDFVKIWMIKHCMVGGFMMRFFKWREDFHPSFEPAICPVWVHLPGLPLYLYKEDVLMSIANAIGRPLALDLDNINRSKLGCASFCVEVDISIEVIDKIWIEFEVKGTTVGGTGFWQKVIFDRLPPYCSGCAHLGHNLERCLRLKKLKDNVQKVGFVEGEGVVGGHHSKGDSGVAQMQSQANLNSLISVAENIDTEVQMGLQGLQILAQSSGAKGLSGVASVDHNVQQGLHLLHVLAQSTAAEAGEVSAEITVDLEGAATAEEEADNTAAGAASENAAVCGKLEIQRGPAGSQDHAGEQPAGETAAGVVTVTRNTDVSAVDTYAVREDVSHGEGAIGRPESLTVVEASKDPASEAEQSTRLRRFQTADGEGFFCSRNFEQTAAALDINLQVQVECGCGKCEAQQEQESKKRGKHERATGFQELDASLRHQGKQGTADSCAVLADNAGPLKQRDPAAKVENEVRIISSSSLSDIEVLAQQEMEKIWTTTNTDAHSNTSPFILDKVGSPVPCSEVIRTSPRLSKVRNYVDSVKNGNSIPALKDKEATMKDKKLYDTLRHKYNEEIRLTFEEHQQNIYATDYTTQKATTQNQEVIPDDAAVDKKEWTTVIRRSQRLNKKQGK